MCVLSIIATTTDGDRCVGSTGDVDEALAFLNYCNEAEERQALWRASRGLRYDMITYRLRCHPVH